MLHLRILVEITICISVDAINQHTLPTNKKVLVIQLERTQEKFI